MKRHPLVKVCGIRDAAIALLAESLGADYLGFIFAEGSPRRVTVGEAAAIVAHLAGKSRLAGVFTDAPVDRILAIAAIVPLSVAQLHSRDYGADDVSVLKAAGLEVWRLYGGGDEADDAADAVLLDGAARGAVGGTGVRADWELARRLAAEGRRVVLAGGISAKNATAAAETGCAVLDVNSSLETAPGVKSMQALREFFEWKSQS